MKPVISPAELLGLSGASLDSRVRGATHHIADITFQGIADRLRADARENGLIYEHNGVPEPVRIMMRPLLAFREQLTYVHHVCLQLTETLKRFASLYIENKHIREVLAISPSEERWLRETWTLAHGRNNPVYGRLDAACDFTAAGWQQTLKFMEPNLSGVGGIHFAPIAEQLIMRDVVPSLLAHDPELAIELPQDQRNLFVQVLIDHARALGRTSCNLCFVEPKYEHDGPDEQTVLSRFLTEQYGLTITHADPRELRVEGEEVYYEDTRVDVAYRDYETRDLIALETELGRPLDGMRLLFRQNRVVSSMVGDFDHKSCFEILTDARLAEQLFSPEDCRLFDRHVLWTRLLADRRTTLPSGASGDLLEFARDNREQLVLKPNRGYGGQGVTMGAATETSIWESLINEAAATSGDPDRSWVVQAATQLPVCEFPVSGQNGRIYSEPFFAVMGFATTDNGLGILCRVSQKQVVNVAQHGGLAAVLVVDAPKDLRIPKRSAGHSADILTTFRSKIAELRHLDQMIALLEWDEETKLPPAGRNERGEQMATLEGIRHGLLVSDRLGDLIDEVTCRNGDDKDLARELYLLGRDRQSAIALPESLVRQFASQKAQTLNAWEDARKCNDFGIFAAPFSQLLGLVRERAQGLAIGRGLYDALLDEHEPELTQSRLEPLFMEIRERLVPLVPRAQEATARNALKLEGRTFPEAEQWQLFRKMLFAVGFDFQRGRIDRSTHPFTMMMGGSDVRLTSRVDERDIASGILATMHEVGHGLYDQGLVSGEQARMLDEGRSMGLHEGLARLWENHIGRSRAFCEFLTPHLHELFPAAMSGLDAEQFFQAINVVRAGVSRVGSDEMSYHLHIVLRYELETALLSGQMAVSDLPSAWGERSASLLGMIPASDRTGVLQDVHWAVGMFGYFPTYTLGSLYAAQLAERYALEFPLQEEIRRGHFIGLEAWLTKNVFRFGSRIPAEQVVAQATGRGLDTAAFFRHIESPDRAWNNPH